MYYYLISLLVSYMLPYNQQKRRLDNTQGMAFQLSLICLISTIVIAFILWRKQKKTLLPPTPMALPIIGHLHLLSQYLTEIFTTSLSVMDPSCTFSSVQSLVWWLQPQKPPKSSTKLMNPPSSTALLKPWPLRP